MSAERPTPTPDELNSQEGISSLFDAAFVMNSDKVSRREFNDSWQDEESGVEPTVEETLKLEGVTLQRTHGPGLEYETITIGDEVYEVDSFATQNWNPIPPEKAAELATMLGTVAE